MKQLGHGADLVAEEASAALILVGWLVSWVLGGKYCTGWLDCWLIVGWLVGERGGGHRKWRISFSCGVRTS